MKKAVVDTNAILRFLTNDIPHQAQKIEDIFKKAQEGKVHLLVLPITVIEILYQFESWYHYGRVESGEKLIALFSAPWLEMDDKDSLFTALKEYMKTSIDFVDLLTWATAQKYNASILSFDKDYDTLTPNLRMKL